MAGSLNKALYLYSEFSEEIPCWLCVYLQMWKNAWLPWLAKATGRSKSHYAREAIVQHLEDLEDIYLAEQRLMDHRKGSSQTISMDEMKRRLELDD